MPTKLSLNIIMSSWILKSKTNPLYSDFKFLNRIYKKQERHMLLFFIYEARREKVSNTTATNNKYGIFPIHFAMTTVIVKYAKTNKTVFFLNFS